MLMRSSDCVNFLEFIMVFIFLSPWFYYQNIPFVIPLVVVCQKGDVENKGFRSFIFFGLKLSSLLPPISFFNLITYLCGYPPQGPKRCWRRFGIRHISGTPTYISPDAHKVLFRLICYAGLHTARNKNDRRACLDKNSFFYNCFLRCAQLCEDGNLRWLS
jgi:hypothetical protein